MYYVVSGIHWVLKNAFCYKHRVGIIIITAPDRVVKRIRRKNTSKALSTML